MNLTSRAARRAAVVAAAACAVLAVPAAIALAAPSSAARSAVAAARPATPMCQTPGLVEWINTNGNGYAGGVVYTLNFTNLSGHTCILNGIPFLYAVNLGGSQVGNRARQDGSNTPNVTIKNGGTASSQLTVVDVFNFPKSRCHPVTAAGFKVFPPNQQTAKIIPFPFSACSARGKGSANFLSVTRVK